MIKQIQALNFRCLKYVHQDLEDFQALVGPNASGKTTFFDILSFVRDLLTPHSDLETVIKNRSEDFQDLLWNRQGDSFELAIESDIPDEVHKKISTSNQEYKRVRYELVIRETEIFKETLSFIPPQENDHKQGTLFPRNPIEPPASLAKTLRRRGKIILKKEAGKNDNYYPEVGKGYKPSMAGNKMYSALGNMPNEGYFPVAKWFRSMLREGVKNIMLDSHCMRRPSKPGQTDQFKPDGANLPWVIDDLKRKENKLFKSWIKHVRTNLSDVKDIGIVERKEDRHKYLRIKYSTGVQVPSWMISDGTLRMLALTLIAYLPRTKSSSLYLIEEPENGMHPRAVETVLQSLTSVYGSQVLMATHSPLILNLLEPNQILCFARNSEGATDIVSGDKHPALKDYRKGHSDSLGTIFASGILG